MRIKALVVIAALGAVALPASAQGYYKNCNDSRKDNQVGGMILGGILGGVLGSNVAASGHRHDGTAVGAVLGGMVGSGIGRGSVNCGPPPGYSSGYGPGSSYGYGPAPTNTYPADPGYSPYGYGGNGRYNDRDIPPPRLYPGDNQAYTYGDDYAGRDCSNAIQITRLPDGTEIRRPVEACRDAYYGDWRVRD